MAMAFGKMGASRAALPALRATMAHPRASITRTPSPAMQPGGVMRLGAPVEFVCGGRRVGGGIAERAGAAGMRGMKTTVEKAFDGFMGDFKRHAADLKNGVDRLFPIHC